LAISTNGIFPKYSLFSFTIFFDLEEIKFENFNISENNIISVEPAKVLRYTLNFHPQKVGFKVILSLPWPHAIHLMGVGSPFSFLGSVQMGNPNAQGTSLLICTKCSHGHSYFPSYEILHIMNMKLP
jgi:hypothetical protein